VDERNRKIRSRKCRYRANWKQVRPRRLETGQIQRGWGSCKII